MSSTHVTMDSLYLRKLLIPHAANLVGAAIAVVDATGAIEYATYGRLDYTQDRPITNSTLFPLASMLKPVLASVIMQLAGEGLLDLDDPIAKHLPETQALNIAHPHAPITIKHLLSHCSGLVDLWTPIQDVESLITQLCAYGLVAIPGTLLSYSNAGYALLGVLITRLTNRKSWQAVVRERVLEPLGIRDDEVVLEEPPSPAVEGFVALDHGFFPDGVPTRQPLYPRLTGLMAAAGSGYATIFAAARLYNAIVLGDERRLPCLQPQRMQALAVRTPGPSVFAEGWGLGWSVIEAARGVVAHTGATAAYVMGSATRSAVVVYLSNTPNAETLGAALAREVLGLGPRSMLPTTMKGPNPSRLAEMRLPGNYVSPLFGFGVRVQGERVVVEGPMCSQGMELESVEEKESCFLGSLGPDTQSEFLFDEEHQPPLWLHAGLRALTRVEDNANSNAS